MNQICFIVPCYNEEKRLPTEEFENYLQNNTNDFFYFVNDGSQDNTIGVLNQLHSKYKSTTKVIDLPENSGKAEAVRQGMIEACKSDQFKYVGFLDADLATPLNEIPSFREHINRSPNKLIYMGSRIKRLGAHIERKILRHYIGRIFATEASFLLGLPVYDTQCGAKLFDANLAKEIFGTAFRSKWLFDVELLFRTINILGKKEALEKIYEIPLNTWYEKTGSKIKIMDMLTVPIDLLAIYFYYKRKQRQ